MATLSALLAEAEASDCEQHFRREGFRTVDEVLSASLTPGDLRDMGVADGGQRNRIMRALFKAAPQALGGGAPEPDGEEEGEDTLALWLGELGAAQCDSLFRAEGFQSLREVVDARLTESDLRELGCAPPPALPRPAAAVLTEGGWAAGWTR